MTTRAQVLDLVETGTTYNEAGSRLGIPPGQAYLVATGIPADGGDSIAPEEAHRRGVMQGSTQYLCNPPHKNPTSHPEALEWARRRALFDAPMRRAADAHRTDPGSVRGEGSQPDALFVLTRRHNKVSALLKALKAVPGVTAGGDNAQLSTRESIADMITVRLSAHEAAEEGHFWPVVRDRLPDGAALAHEAVGQEQQAADVLQRISTVPASEAEFDELAEKLARLAHVHVAFEERVFLQVRAVVPEEDLHELGGRLVEAHDVGPTRPHPRAPRGSGPAARAAAVMASAIDERHDRQGRPADRKGRPDEGTPRR